ncbi:MAG: DUF3604 domain-containing protein [Oscillospiraceae bacterium]|nr:DUF3604 domain-containing protein [Oscillospiraceae bacterium]
MERIRYAGPTTIKANQLFRCAVEVRVEKAIEEGGMLTIASRHTSDIGDAQGVSRDLENYVEVKADRPGVSLAVTGTPGGHPWNRGFSVEVKAGALAPGDVVRVEMGGDRGFRAQSFSEERSGFRLGIRRGKGGPWEVAPREESRLFTVTGAEPAIIRAYVRDVNGVGRRTLSVKAEDAYGNVASPGELAVDVVLDDVRFLGEVRLKGGLAIADSLDLPDDGRWHTLSVSSGDGRFHSRTNPFGPCLAEGYGAFFGDIHGQSDLCDGTNGPGSLYAYARVAAGMDFASVTSHDMELDDGAWAEVADETRKANRPGDFVAFLGYEWSGLPDEGGDNNVYYLSGEGPLVRNSAIDGPWCVPGVRSERIDLRETIRRIRASTDGFMVIPHCGGRQSNPDYHDPTVMPVFEIHSTHRNYEHVWAGLVDRGLRLGLVGGSDDHRGMLGDCGVAARERYFSTHCGLAVAMARELTPESIWDAIMRRHTYATNGPHIVVGFSSGDRIMGDEMAVPAGSPIAFKLRAVCHGFFQEATVFRGNVAVKSYRGGDQENQIRSFEAEFVDEALPGASMYYLRVAQADGGMAWTSPIFVEGT